MSDGKNPKGTKPEEKEISPSTQSGDKKKSPSIESDHEDNSTTASSSQTTPKANEEKYLEGTKEDLERDLVDHPNEKKFEEVVRILSWPKFAYYEILELKEGESDVKIIGRQYRKYAAFVHPDKNKDVRAKEAFQNLSEAYDNLVDDSKRKEYDGTRKGLKAHGLLKQEQKISQEFEEGAFNNNGDDSDSESEMDTDDDEPPIDAPRRAIRQEMVPFIKKMMENPEDAVNRGKLKRLNKRILELNSKEGKFQTSHTLPIPAMQSIAKAAQPILAALNKDPNDKAKQEDIHKLNEKLKTSWGDQDDIPEDCLIPIPRPSKKSGRKQASSANTSGSNGNNTSDKMDLDSTEYKPGYTEDGLKILAYRPVTRWCKTMEGEDIQTMEVDDWVIENDGNNPIALVTSATVGPRAVEAYLKLPEAEKNSITNCDKKYDRRDRPYFGELLGFDSKSSDTGILGFGVGLINYKGEPIIVNRTALRKVWTEKVYRQNLQNFWKEIGQPSPEYPPRLRLEQRIENARRKLLIEDVTDQARRRWDRKRLLLASKPWNSSDSSGSGSDSEGYLSSRHKLTELLEDESDSDSTSFKRRRSRRHSAKHKGNSKRTASKGKQADSQGHGNEAITRQELDEMMKTMMAQFKAMMATGK